MTKWWVWIWRQPGLLHSESKDDLCEGKKKEGRVSKLKSLIAELCIFAHRTCLRDAGYIETINRTSDCQMMTGWALLLKIKMTRQINIRSAKWNMTIFHCIGSYFRHSSSYFGLSHSLQTGRNELVLCYLLQGGKLRSCIGNSCFMCQPTWPAYFMMNIS